MSKISEAIGLGIDAGGTQTRWALATASGDILASGQVSGLTALQLANEAGREHIRQQMSAIAQATTPDKRPTRICAGITGYTNGDLAMRELLGATFDMNPGAITLHSDIEITCLDLFLPGQGYVIYAGTGSIAAFIDADGNFHRAGGRGAIVDDAGSGFWIAVEALRHIWRGEDTKPGSWRDSPMAVALFDQLGGKDWAATRQFVYSRERGEIGKLAIAVAATADRDATAAHILGRAGHELARLGLAMISRFGSRPLALSGRVSQLHPLIEKTLRAALPPETDLQVRHSEAHVAAARLAAKST